MNPDDPRVTTSSVNSRRNDGPRAAVSRCLDVREDPIVMNPQSEGIDLTARPAGPPEPTHNGGDPVNGQVKEAAAGVSVIAPNPLVLPEEIKSLDNSGSKAPFERPIPVDFIAAESKMPVFPTASIPVSAAPESKGHPVHPLTSKLQEQAGIPTPFEGRGPPAESGGTPSHPVESKVSARPMEGGKPLEPLVAPSIPAAIPVEQNQFMNPSLPRDEPSLPVVSVASMVVEPLPAPPAPAPSPPIPVTSQVQAASASLPHAAPSDFPAPSQPSNEPSLPPSPVKIPASAPLVADHVESLLENMFQGGDESPVKQSVIVANTKAPALTEDRVVAILEDKSPVEAADVNPVVIKSEPEKGNTFQEVESELEKMFAGIVEDVEDVKPALTKTEPQQSAAEAPKKRKRSVGKPRPRKSVDSDQAVPAKRGRKRGMADKKVGKKPRHDKIKEASNDSTNLGGLLPRKGPFIHIKGSKENPTKICVVNSGSRDEEERERAMDKHVARRKHQYVEGRLKGSGLYSSTLSSKYNSQNADLTWVCIFCKLRSNCERGLGGEPAGDLFGPYILTVPKDPDQDSRDPKDVDVVAEQKRRGGGKQAASLRATGAVEQFVKDVSKKSKKQLAVGEDLSGEREIWVHEKCAVWAPGVFLVGPHLIGLAEAVAAASVTKCSYCSNFGASLGCVVRNCPVRCHYGCAVATRWDLNYDSFIAKCPNHTRQIKS
ncbi:hypothetical protein GE061_007427 [Apolygus lucorum]|uniref:PHD-type domain-containing protein n=1 Tax=Apolygus lucorum TaxID=248454 RepID=A0A8S9WTE7_APOLU|nr:hypothetical protein GE061_007427 [Apolygus lucorum]